MVSRKMSPILSKLLNDVQVPSDSEIMEINNGITEDVIELSESNQNAEDLLEGIEETSAAIEKVETTGLQSDIDVVSVKLLANELNHAVRKLSAGYKKEVSGLQNDNKDTFLRDSLEEAKGIVAVAKDELDKVVKNISERVISLDSKIEEMKKWLDARENNVAIEDDKKSETIEAIAELIESVKETSKDINESEAVETEMPTEATDAMDNISENLEEIDNVDKEEEEEN